MVLAYTTIGTPIAITGIPSDSWLSSDLVFPTPEPGLIPESQSCTVLLIRAARLEANASIAIIASGLTLSTTPLTTSIVSTPVIPSTPGAMAHEAGTSPSNASGMYCLICLVICTFDTTSGPSESGVTPLLPRPTTRIVLEELIFSRLRISSASNLVVSSNISFVRVSSSWESSVMYVPFFLPICFAATSFRILIRLISILPFCTVSSSIPDSSLLSSLSSAARSVYMCICPSFCLISISLCTNMAIILQFLPQYIKKICNLCKKKLDYISLLCYNRLCSRTEREVNRFGKH